MTADEDVRMTARTPRRTLLHNQMNDAPPFQTPSRSTHNLQRPWTAWLVIGLLSIPLIFFAVRSPQIDFRAFYVAAQATAAHLDPYADNHLHGPQYTDLATATGGSRWIYPPAALFFVAPLGWVSYGVARVFFDGASIAALAWMLVDLGRRFKISTLWLAIGLISLPVIACLQRGQVDILILFCIFLSYRYLGSGWAGVPLALAISIKIFPGAILLWWLLEKRFRDVAVTVACSAALALLAAWRFGWGSYAGFLHNLTTLHAQTPSASAASLAGEPLLALRQGFVGSYNNPLILFDHAGILIGFVLILVSAYFLWRQRAASEFGFFAMALASQWMNTTLWAMGLVLYLPICILALSRNRSRIFVFLLFLPLYLPSQIRVLGIAPRFVLAFALIGIAMWKMPLSESGKRVQL